MILKAIINEIADQADDLLEGVSKRDEARAAVAELLTIKHPSLSGLDRTKVIDGVMAILEEEGFFEQRAGDSDDDSSDDNSGEDN